MDPRPLPVNNASLALKQTQPLRYIDFIKRGFKRALGYELLAFLSMFGLLTMIAKG